MLNCQLSYYRRGYKEDEIEEAFKKFDTDGNKVLDRHEQQEMLRVLEEEKVGLHAYIKSFCTTNTPGATLLFLSCANVNFMLYCRTLWQRTLDRLNTNWD